MKNNLPLRVIPVWLRVLAAVVAAAAAFAIFLVIRGVPGQVVDVAGFIRLGAEAILFLCVAVLFGYVAATGLPPAHLWRQAGAHVVARTAAVFPDTGHAPLSGATAGSSPADPRMLGP